LLVGLDGWNSRLEERSVASKTDIMPEFRQEEKKEMDVDLIRRDVGRSVLFRYRTGAPDDASDRLAHVLEQAVRGMHYYQGLHDVAGSLLHQVDYQEILATALVSRLAQSHFRDAMRENFGNITWLLSVLLLPLVEQVEPHVHYALVVTEVELPNICLPWVITWFTHDVYQPAVAGRLADAFLAGHPLLPIYFAVALLTHPILKPQILTADEDDPANMFLIVKQFTKYIGVDLVCQGQPDGDSSETVVPVQELLEDALTIMYVSLSRFCPTEYHVTKPSLQAPISSPGTP